MVRRITILSDNKQKDNTMNDVIELAIRLIDQGQIEDARNALQASLEVVDSAEDAPVEG